MREAETKRERAGGQVRIGGALGIPIVLKSLGVDPAEVLAEAGVDPKLFEDPNNLISFAARNRLAALGVARTGCPHFGLLVGQQQGLNSLGLTGLLVKYSPDVGTALRNVVRHTHLHVTGAAFGLAVDGSVASFSYDIYEPHAEGHDQIGDGAMAAFYNALRELCGPEWKPLEVRFAHRKPADLGPFRRFFRVPLSFDAEQYALCFASYWLNRHLPETDPELRRLLRSQIDALEAHFGDNFPDQVRRVLRSALVARHAKADQVAALFSMHSRSLNRHLHAFGTSFQQILDEIRYEFARQMLEDSTMELGEIAAALDYAAPGIFTRAFRRWSGVTPADWRAAHRQAEQGSSNATLGSPRRSQRRTDRS
jgi:AraC-like DNA-binding protein